MQVMCGKTVKQSLMNFKVSSLFQLVCVCVQLVKDPRHAWTLLGANIG